MRDGGSTCLYGRSGILGAKQAFKRRTDLVEGIRAHVVAISLPARDRDIELFASNLVMRIHPSINKLKPDEKVAYDADHVSAADDLRTLADDLDDVSHWLDNEEADEWVSAYKAWRSLDGDELANFEAFLDGYGSVNAPTSDAIVFLGEIKAKEIADLTPADPF